MSFDQAISLTSLDLRLGSLDKTARQWVLRIERGKLRLELLVLIGDLGQLLRQLLGGHIPLIEDAEHGQSCALSDTEPVAQVDNSIGKGTNGSRRRRLGQLLHLLRSEPIRDDGVSTSDQRGALIAACLCSR